MNIQKNTATCLKKAFEGEAASYTKYKLFADAARNAGYEEIAQNYYATADNELAHAEMWLNELEALGDTEPHLNESAEDENNAAYYEYPSYADTAELEGNERMKNRFLDIAEIEKRHAEQFKSYLSRLRSDDFFSSEAPVEWSCMNCGYTVNGTAAPIECPLCYYSKRYFIKR